MNHRHLIALCLLAAMLAACKRPADDATAPSPSPDAQQQAPAANAAKAPETPPTAEVTGKPEMPTLRTTTIDGKPYDLAQHRGNWVVVNFWATWCAPCLKEMPELSALDAMRQHVEVIGLAYEDIDPEELRAFLEKHPVVYPVAIIDVYNPPADFATPRGLPMTYLIAPDGKVAKQFLGPVSAKDIEGAIAAAGGPTADSGSDAKD
ncbi:TlpA family protein disulfide reductase [Luteimonas sp. 22616]|uniref:TlpA family protein disulfide reductase n=1 Tax=Luteimonas sp. 22616 TaxID=3453951 RepID=UPI003F86A418